MICCCISSRRGGLYSISGDINVDPDRSGGVCVRLMFFIFFWPVPKTERHVGWRIDDVVATVVQTFHGDRSGRDN